MINLRRSGSDLPCSSGDITHLEYVARCALDRGETVELQIDRGPWRSVTSSHEVRDTLRELYDELDAHRDDDQNAIQLPFAGEAS